MMTQEYNFTGRESAEPASCYLDVGIELTLTSA